MGVKVVIPKVYRWYGMMFTFLPKDFNLKIDKKFINILWDLTKARSLGDFKHLPYNNAELVYLELVWDQNCQKDKKGYSYIYII